MNKNKWAVLLSGILFFGARAGFAQQAAPVSVPEGAAVGAGIPGPVENLPVFIGQMGDGVRSVLLMGDPMSRFLASLEPRNGADLKLLEFIQEKLPAAEPVSDAAWVAALKKAAKEARPAMAAQVVEWARCAKAFAELGGDLEAVKKVYEGLKRYEFMSRAAKDSIRELSSVILMSEAKKTASALQGAGDGDVSAVEPQAAAHDGMERYPHIVTLQRAGSHAEASSAKRFFYLDPNEYGAAGRNLPETQAAVLQQYIGKRVEVFVLTDAPEIIPGHFDGHMRWVKEQAIGTAYELSGDGGWRERRTLYQRPRQQAVRGTLSLVNGMKIIVEVEVNDQLRKQQHNIFFTPEIVLLRLL